MFYNCVVATPQIASREEALYRVAEAQGGYFALPQAREAGYSPQLLQHHRKRGRLLRVGRGIYRLARFPGWDTEDLMVVWLWSEQAGIFSHETALGLHDLSDALPHKVDLTLPLDWEPRRLRVPPRTILHFAEVPEGERAWKGYLPVVTPARAILDCARNGSPPDLVWSALYQGLHRRLFAMDRVAEAIAYCQQFDLPRLP